jgi:hypothetical protein
MFKLKRLRYFYFSFVVGGRIFGGAAISTVCRCFSYMTYTQLIERQYNGRECIILNVSRITKKQFDDIVLFNKTHGGGKRPMERVDL